MLKSASFTSCVYSSKSVFVCSSFHPLFGFCFVFFCFVFVQSVKCTYTRVWEETTRSTPLDEQSKATKPAVCGYYFTVVFQCIQFCVEFDPWVWKRIEFWDWRHKCIANNMFYLLIKSSRVECWWCVELVTCNIRLKHVSLKTFVDDVRGLMSIFEGFYVLSSVSLNRAVSCLVVFAILFETSF